MDIPFSHFADLVQTLSRIPPTPATQTAKARALPSKAHIFLFKWIESVQQRDQSTGMSGLVPGCALGFFRLLFPEDDRRRYGLQESTLAELLADTTSVSTQHRGASLRAWAQRSTSGVTGCLGHELQHVLEASRSNSSSQPEKVTLKDIDELLSELAMLSPFSQLEIQHPPQSSRSRKAIIRDLYRHLSPFESAVVTQIILRDLRPLLYPGTLGMHPTAALTTYNSQSYHVLTKWEAMKLWNRALPDAYRARGSFEAACAAWDSGCLAAASLPLFGVPVEIPKSVKATSCSQILQLYAGATSVYAETKYDGERMQIHIDLGRDSSDQVKIFSKSKRDSTWDRYATLSIIRDALQGDNVMSAILEAEMVAYSNALGRIDEFWRIRSLVESTAKGIRSVARQANAQKETQDSMVSDASDNGTRHLAVVFFDILMLNGESLLDTPYNDRRSRLEEIISCRSGYAMLAERICLNMTSTDAIVQVQTAFARRCAEFEEGLIFKASDGLYNDYLSPWAKLKKDYIEGLGDCVDLVLFGASWDKDRGRSLGVGPRTYTTFWIGCVGAVGLIALFTSSYGLSRTLLEELNFVIGGHDPLPWDKTNPEATLRRIPYVLQFTCGAARPEVILTVPLLVEVVGAGFTKAKHAQYYELRFPRITKFHRHSERSWTAAVCLPEYTHIARHCIGKDGREKYVSDEVKAMWGIDSSPGVRSSPKRKAREEDLIDQLQLVSFDKRRKAAANNHPNGPFHALSSTAGQITALNATFQIAVEPATGLDSSAPSLVIGGLPTPQPSSPTNLPSHHADADLFIVRSFLSSCLCSVLQPRGSALASRATDNRPRTHVLFAEGRLFHSIQALLIALDWTDTPSGQSPRSCERGLIFVDATDTDLCATLTNGLTALSEQRTASSKDLWVLDAEILNWVELPTFTQQLASRTLWATTT